jgi:hypothetical protein
MPIESCRRCPSFIENVYAPCANLSTSLGLLLRLSTVPARILQLQPLRWRSPSHVLEATLHPPSFYLSLGTPLLVRPPRGENESQATADMGFRFTDRSLVLDECCRGRPKHGFILWMYDPLTCSCIEHGFYTVEACRRRRPRFRFQALIRTSNARKL